MSQEFKVKDISLADFGRKEINIKLVGIFFGLDFFISNMINIHT